MSKQHNFKKHNNFKPSFRANGSALLPLALRPGLGSVGMILSNLFNYSICRALKFAMIILTFCFIFQNSYSNNVSATSITLTIPSESLSLNISDPSSNNGFNKSELATISVKTDSSSGYTLSIKSKNSDSDMAKSNDLTNTSNPSSKLTSILAAVPESDFSSSGSANTWGYLPSKLNSADNSNFLPGPTSDPATIDTTDSANNEVSNNYDITLAVKVDSSTPSGIYSNTFVITAVVNQPKTMQDFDCDSLQDYETTQQIAELTDSRDGNTYEVAKLKDGRCWMVENLRLGSSELANRTITPEDSDVGSDFTLPENTIDGFTSDYDVAQNYVDSNYGGYYTWKAATAGTGTGSMESGNASSSICPKGWRLPTGGPGGEFDVMAKKYGPGTDQTTMSALRTVPVPNFVFSGNYWYSKAHNQGSAGYFWSSTVNNDLGAHSLSLYLSGVNPNNASGKGNGFPIRCIARENIEYDITFNDNSGSGGPGTQTGTTKDSFIKIDSTQPSRSDYQFKGWCDEETSDGTCSGTTYQPGDDYNILDNRNTATLYAVWKPSSCPQPVTDCQVDTYQGKRFGDGPCWMAADYQKSVTWSGKSCPSSWGIPSKTDFDNLVSSSQAGSGACLYEQGWNLNGYSYPGQVYDNGVVGHYWSSTTYDSGNAYYLRITKSSAYVDNNSVNTTVSPYGSGSVRCLSRLGI